MARGINKVILVGLYQDGASIPEVAERTGLHRSTVRYHLAKSGVLRSRAEGVRIAASKGKLGSGLRGKKRVFSAAHKARIAESRLRHSAMFARGVSVSSGGYFVITRGEHKGRSEHRVIIEHKIGRRLRTDEHVHHIDGNKQNNAPSNLRVMTGSDHMRIHATESAPTRERDNHGRFI